MEGEVFEVPQFIPFVHNLTKQFIYGFAYNAPKVWNEMLLCHISSIFSEEAESLYLHKSLPTLGFSYFLIVSVVGTPPAVSLD